jgi:hypothetical protein
MALREYRCGSSSAVYHAAPAGRPIRAEPRTARLCTPIHFRSQPVAHGFRVVAELSGGRRALVCLGASRSEALAGVRARGKALPAGSTGLRLQHWVGGVRGGRWQDLRCRRGELPWVPGVRGRSPLLKCRAGSARERGGVSGRSGR